jgi:HTH-type transcriptional regulator, cell division transcriptional repressor
MTESGWFSAEAATFGDRLAGAREAAGMTQADLARTLGVRLATLAAWEDDAAEPRANRLQMLAGMLNVSIRWLLTGEGDGLEGPAAPQALRPGARETLNELAGLRARALALAEELGGVEKRLRVLMREDAA